MEFRPHTLAREWQANRTPMYVTPARDVEHEAFPPCLRIPSLNLFPGTFREP
jgi:hypothetical protein